MFVLDFLMIISSGSPFVLSLFNTEDFVMKNYQKLFIGITAICLFAACAVPASAAIPTRVKVKAKDFITKTSTSLGNAIWNNKGSIAVGSAAVALATNPAPFVSGATTMITGRPSDPSATSIQSYFTGWLFYAIATVLAVLGVRFAWNYVKDYKNWLPLMIVGILLCSVGVAEAGIIQPLLKPPVLLPPVPWWSLFNVALIVATIFM
jgi:hypothetical protein